MQVPLLTLTSHIMLIFTRKMFICFDVKKKNALFSKMIRCCSTSIHPHFVWVAVSLMSPRNRTCPLCFHISSADFFETTAMIGRGQWVYGCGISTLQAGHIGCLCSVLCGGCVADLLLLTGMFVFTQAGLLPQRGSCLLFLFIFDNCQ